MAKKRSNGSSTERSQAPRATPSTYADKAALPPSTDTVDTSVTPAKADGQVDVTPQEQWGYPEPQKNEKTANETSYLASSVDNVNSDKPSPANKDVPEQSQEAHHPKKTSLETDGSDGHESAGPSPPPNKKDLPAFAEVLQSDNNEHASSKSPAHLDNASKSAKCPAHSSLPVVSQHVQFFDRSGRGIITPFDTFYGFRELGFGLLLSFISAVFIHGAFSLPSWGWRFDWRFTCRVDGMRLCKHGSDSGVYRVDGSLDENKFDEMWRNWSKDGETMDSKELRTMVADHRVVFDPFGWTAAIAEWGVTYLLLSPKDGRFHKEDIKKLYTGELFWEIGGHRERAKTGKKHNKRA